MVKVLLKRFPNKIIAYPNLISKRRLILDTRERGKMKDLG